MRVLHWSSKHSPAMITASHASVLTSLHIFIATCAQDPNPRRSHRTKRYADYAMNFTVKRKGIPDLSNYPSNRTAPPSWPLK